jgi:hypothetical protein
MAALGQLRTLATYPCYVRSWVTSGRGEEVVGTSVHSHKQTLGDFPGTPTLQRRMCKIIVI